MVEKLEIYTIGHSTHTEERFLTMLQFASIKTLVDVRAFPGSRKHPQFKQENMIDWLAEAGVTYVHLPRLGGRRSGSADVGLTLNEGWRNDSFHNYADYTLSTSFKQGVDELLGYARKASTAYFCSERHPARCHRLIISNYLQAHDVSVKHILDKSGGQTEIISHILGKWGAMPIIEDDGEVVYPKLDK